MAKIKVAHLTSHHNILDNRIFYRECKTLAEAGYEVVLVAQHDQDEVKEGVRIAAVPRHDNRLARVTSTAARVVGRALKEQAQVYHFHDPELIPWGFGLRAMGKQVIYDVHEDFAQAAGVRPWLPDWARKGTATAYNGLAAAARRAFTIIIAERYYTRSFPGAVEVLNYPHLERSAALRAIPRSPETQPERLRLLYVGNVTWSRGALIHAELCRRLEGSEMLMIGGCTPAMAEQIASAAGDVNLGHVTPQGETVWQRRSSLPEGRASTLVLDGVGFYVPHERMIERFKEPWTAGVAVFPYTEHYFEKELTKFFEYMAAGLPLVLSHFPTWKELVETPGAGRTVDPANWDEIIGTIRHLHEHPDEAVALGRKGRRAVEERFSWASQARNLLGVYARLLGRAAPASA